MEIADRMAQNRCMPHSTRVSVENNRKQGPNGIILCQVYSRERIAVLVYLELKKKAFEDAVLGRTCWDISTI